MKERGAVFEFDQFQRDSRVSSMIEMKDGVQMLRELKFCW